MGNDLQTLLARLAAGQFGAAGTGAAPSGSGMMPAGLLSDATPNGTSGIFPGEPGGPTAPPTQPQTQTPAAKLPVTPPVLPYQGDYSRYGAGPEHLFFGGVGQQPYGLTSFSGQAAQQPDAKAMEDLFRKLWDQQQDQQQQNRNRDLELYRSGGA